MTTRSIIVIRVVRCNGNLLSNRLGNFLERYAIESFKAGEVNMYFVSKMCTKRTLEKVYSRNNV